MQLERYGETAKPSTAYAMAGAITVWRGSRPRSARIAHHAGRAPGTPTARWPTSLARPTVAMGSGPSAGSNMSARAARGALA
jgi:hypothetical protein